MTAMTADQLLAELMQQGRLQKTVPIDVDAVAEALGVQVRYDYSSCKPGEVGKIEFSSYGHPVVTINPTENSYIPRRRFTLAHELGHFVLHSKAGKTEFTDSRQSMSRMDSYWDSYEFQANTFAAELLMPRDLIVSEANALIARYRERNHTDGMPTGIFIGEMAERFLVSSQSMEFRLKNLGIVRS